MNLNKYVAKSSKYIVGILFAQLISTIAISIIPILTKKVIDNYNIFNKTMIIQYAIAYIVSIILFLGFEYVKKISIILFHKKYATEIKQDIFHNITTINHSVLNSKENGDYVNAIINDTENIYNNYIYCALELVMSCIAFIVYMSYMIYLNFFLSIIIVITCMLTLFIPKLVGNNLQNKRKAQSDSQAKFIDEITDLINSKEAFNKYNSSQFDTKFKIYNDQFENTLQDLLSYKAYTDIFSGFSLYAINIITFVIGLVFIYYGKIEMSSLIAVIGYIDLVAIPIKDIIFEIITIKSSYKIVDKVNQFFYTNTLEFEPKSFSKIEIKNLSYQQKSFQLTNINISIISGKKYAIIGDNGSGKSTIFKLLAKELQPPKGTIYIDGIDINNICLDKLLYYASKPFIFKGTIKENISISSADGSIKIDNKDFIYDMPQNVSYNGNNLSLGEKGKISVARAINSQKDFIILDEPFSNIDKKSEQALTKELIKNIDTLILITHNRDISYLDQFDIVYIVENGTVRIR